MHMPSMLYLLTSPQHRDVVAVAAASFLCYSLLSVTIGHKVIPWVLPRSKKEKILEKARNDREFSLNLNVNGIAIINATFFTICGLYFLLNGAGFYAETPLSGYCKLYACFAAACAGYFVWDLLICFYYYEVFGIGFMVHGVLSFIGSCMGMYSELGQLPFMVCIFAMAEASSPFLHIRWVLLRTKQQDGWSFVVANCGFMLTFVTVRILAVPIYILLPLLKDTYRMYILGQVTESTLLPWQRWIHIIVMSLWYVLNTYWFSIALRNTIIHFLDKANLKKRVE